MNGYTETIEKVKDRWELMQKRRAGPDTPTVKVIKVWSVWAVIVTVFGSVLVFLSGMATQPQRIARSVGAFIDRIMPGATIRQKQARFSAAVETFTAGEFENDADMIAKLQATTEALEEYAKALE